MASPPPTAAIPHYLHHPHHHHPVYQQQGAPPPAAGAGAGAGAGVAETMQTPPPPPMSASGAAAAVASPPSVATSLYDPQVRPPPLGFLPSVPPFLSPQPAQQSAPPIGGDWPPVGVQSDGEIPLSNGTGFGGGGHVWMGSPAQFLAPGENRKEGESWHSLNGLSQRSDAMEGSRKGPALPVATNFSPPPPPSFRPVSQIRGPPGPPIFSSPLRPTLTSFNNTPSSPLMGPAPFSEIPFHSPKGSANRAPSDGNRFRAVDALQSTMSQDDFETSSWSAASSFVLLSAHSLVRNKKLANIASLGFGALVCPGREVMPEPPKIARNPFRCQNCGAYANLYCSIVPSSGRWKCPLCRTINSSEGEYRAASKEELQNWPELVTSVVDFVDVSNHPPGFVPVADTTMAAPVVILIDESLDEPHLQHLQSSLHAFLDTLPPSTRVGLVTYGVTVSVYDFSESGVAAADVFPGNATPTKELLKMLVYGTGVYLAPLHVCLSVAHNIVSSLRPYRGELAEPSRDRCLGTAVEVALSLIQGPSAEMPRIMVKRAGGNSHIVVCAGGPTTLGVGSVPHSQSHPQYAYLERKAVRLMEQIGQEARQHDTIVDILCAGTCPVRISILQPLVVASGGVLVLHDDFGESFGLNLQRSVKRAKGFRGVLEARFSDCIGVTRVIGPGKEAALDGHESFKNDKAVAVQMLNVDECQSFAFTMELQEDIEEENVYFQFVARFTETRQINVTRIVTIRIPATSSLSTYLQSVDEEVAAVLIGKRTVLLAKDASDAINMRASVDERMKDIAFKFGKAMPKTKLRRFPSELARLPEILFHLSRGPLLGSIVCHEDERAVIRNLFLHASFDLSMRILSPRLLIHREGGTFEELPAYDIAMQSDTALVLDHGTDVFIWMGSDLAANEAQSAAALVACRTLAEELTEQRFPAPRILAFKEGSSQARYLQARLIPVHKDPPYEQEARFPQLRSLKADQRAKLKSSFLHVDDLSMCEWMRSLKLIPPDPC